MDATSSSKNSNRFQQFYDRGIAIGIPDIRTDCIHFFFKGEEFDVPTYSFLSYPHKARYTGQFYEAKIKDVRKHALK